MLLKRIHEPDENGVLRVHVKRASKQRINFTPKLVTQACAEGWMSLVRGKIIIHGQDGDHTFKIVYQPGRYCAHCDAKLEDDEKGIAARRHVAEKHAGVPSPDPGHPAGYLCDNFYECELVELPTTPKAV